MIVWRDMFYGIPIAIIVFGSCSKNDYPSSTQESTGSTLNANPQSVAVIGGQTRNTIIYGGVHPYLITVAPAASFASAQFLDANVDTAILQITGVGVASGSTSVTVKDSSPSPQKHVTVSIVKQ